MVAKTIVITGGSSFTLPADWSPLSNTIHALGAGGAGAGANVNYSASQGGPSGCYARIDNLNLPPGTVCSLHIGTSGAYDTWFYDPSIILAKGAQTTTAGCVGSLVYPGAPGGWSPDGGFSGGGGGGASGPHGAGLPGVPGNVTGGAPDANFYGAQAQWQDSASGLLYGPGAGGRGGNYGQYGGGAAGWGAGGGAAGVSGSTNFNPGGAGWQGILVLVYNVAGKIAATEAPDAASAAAIVFDHSTLASAEDQDTAAFSGFASAFGPLAGAEAPDTPSLTALVKTIGAVAAIEGGDSAAVSAVDFLAANAAPVEAPDVAASIGVVEFNVALAASESPDLCSGVVQLPAIISLAASEAPDTAFSAAMLGAIWPRLTVVASAAEDSDGSQIAVAVGPIGNLEQQGVGGQLIYSASAPLERALADVDVARMMAVPARLVTENLEPWKVASRNLVFLAYGMGVTLWETSWSETTRREWVAGQWAFKQAVGSLPAFGMALSASGYDISDYVLPPGGFFVSPDLTVDETNAWIRQMPQIRIKFADKTGTEGVDEMFAAPDGASGIAPGPDDSFWDYAAIGLDDGRALYGNIAVLRHADGSEVPLEIWDRVDTTMQVSEQVFEQTSVPAFLPDANFLDEDFIDDARYASPDAGEGHIYSFIVPKVANVTTPALAMTPLVPGLAPLSPTYEIESDVEYDLIPSAFSGDWGVNIEYLTPDDGPMLLAHVMYLLDPAVTSPMTAGVSYVDDARIGIPIDYAELAINTHTLLPENTFVLNDNWNGEDFASPEDLTDFYRAGRAVLAAKALRDTILLSFEGSLEADTVTDTSRVPIPSVLPGGVGAIDVQEDGSDTASLVAAISRPRTLEAVEEPDIALATGTVILAGSGVAIETGDAAVFIGSDADRVVAFAAAEDSDVAAITVFGARPGIFDAVEGQDTAIFSVTAELRGVLAAVEWPDQSDTGLAGVLDFRQSSNSSLAGAIAP